MTNAGVRRNSPAGWSFPHLPHEPEPMALELNELSFIHQMSEYHWYNGETMAEMARRIV